MKERLSNNDQARGEAGVPFSYVEGETEASFEGTETGERAKKEAALAEMERYTEEAHTMIASYRRFFNTFAKDISLRFELSNRFMIDLEQGVVHNDVRWYHEKGFSKEQILWAHLHELTHFRDLAEDPEAMEARTERLMEQARETGATLMEKWEAVYGESDPELIEKLKQTKPISRKDPNKTFNRTEIAAFRFYHTFYNIADDIWVNNSVARRAPRYQKKTKGGKEIESLYREKLFPKTDYKELPRHLQFLYALLREEMVPDEEVQVSDEVAEVLDRKVLFQGKEHTAREIVERFIKPRRGRDTTMGQRDFAAQKTLEPIFEKLLAKDIEEWEPQKPKIVEVQQGEEGEQGEGEEQVESGNPFEGEYKEFSENSPDQLDPGEIDEWGEKHQEESKARKAKPEEPEEYRGAQERADEAQEELDRVWCDKHDVSIETFQKFRKIEAEVEPYLDELSQLWRHIVFGSSEERKRAMEGHFKTGTELDIPRAIEEWPRIEKRDLEQTRVMKKMVTKEQLVEQPELIRVRLVGDLSYSMTEGERVHILQQCFVLVLSSLREFNTYLNMTRAQTKSKLRVDTEARVFGETTKRIKKFQSETSPDEEQAEIIRIFEKLYVGVVKSGSTHDHKPLEDIDVSISEEEREKIAKKKIMEIVLEVTDGGSYSARETRRVVDKLTDDGIIARAFQIGEADEGERALFNEVWNDNREEHRGEIVGTQIENLLPAVTELLKKYLRNVRV